MLGLKFVFFIGLAFKNIGICKSSSSLYSEENPGVVILRQHNFDSLVPQSNFAWLVQFYNPHCGHCINYAPTYKGLAADLLGWSGILKIGVVDCIELGSSLCNRFVVRGTPSFRLFTPFSPLNETGQQIYHHSIASWHTALLTFLSQIKVHPPYWPDFKFTSVPDSRLAFTELAARAAADGSQFLGLLLTEPPESNLGVAVILDGFGVKQKQLTVAVRRAPTSIDNKPISSTQLYRFFPGHPPLFQLVASGDSVQIRASLHTQIQLTNGNYTVMVPDLQSSNVSTSPIPVRYHSNLRVEDLENGLYLLLVQEVGIFDDLDAPRIALLCRFLNSVRRTLRRVLPNHVIAFLNNVCDILARLVNGPSVVPSIELSVPKQYRRCAKAESGARKRTAKEQARQSNRRQSREADATMENFTIDLPLNRSEWIDVLVAAHRSDRSAFLPVPHVLDGSMWVGCRGSQPILRGYSCSLWQLFHTMTVQQAVLSRMGSDPVVDEKMLVTTIRDFVLAFFSCRECATNFMHETASLTTIGHMAPGEGMVWLWQVHNSVNRRLGREGNEDPGFPKRLFPTATECARCHAAPSPDANRTLAELEITNQTVVWNMVAVVRFLEQTYGAAGIQKGSNGLFNPAAITRRHKCGEPLELRISDARRSLEAPHSSRLAGRPTDNRHRNRHLNFADYAENDSLLQYGLESDTGPVGRNDLLIVIVVYSFVFILFVCVYMSFILKRGQRAKFVRYVVYCEYFKSGNGRSF